MQDQNFADCPRAEPSKPWWVKVSLLGVPNRFLAVACGWGCIVLAAAILVYGLRRPWMLFVVPLALLGSWPYFASVAWMDRNDGWKGSAKQL